LVRATTIYENTSSFHVSLLEPFKKSTISQKTQSPPPCIEIDNYREYEAEKVLDLRQK